MQTIQAKPCVAPVMGHCTAGEYPQTVASPMAVRAMSPTPDERGYYRSDYDGNLYAKLTVSAQAEGELSDGTVLCPGEQRYFLVEPMGWYTLPLDETHRLLVSRRVLFASPYHPTSNAWATSSVRATLQSWVVCVFSPDEQRKLCDIALDNDSVGQRACYGGKRVTLVRDAMPWCTQPPSTDSVFLLSKAAYDSLRLGGIAGFTATDYARAMGVYTNWDGTATGWLRSAECHPDRAFIFGVEDDEADMLCVATGRRVDEYMGVLPAICLRDGQE